ncbi:MAG: LysR substrate-binding domain-containing protein [Rouxiella badensis]|uniref:LysR substrate-binding domain-containing protein n=1 Tax=Rouxiella badensis TaxID=1646377 RepID=UPI0028D8E3FD|nr:LysR substrate-binding domain-containing protein [Rouxiella badensis]
MTKRPLTFDSEALRTFVTGIELGSFVLAAERLGRSTSAISAQLKKLEHQAGTALVQKAGRHLVLTEKGELMLGYARRLLSLNDEAYALLMASEVGGEVRLGLQEDFGEALLPAILGQFSRSHPNVQISASVTRNEPLLSAIRQNELDLALSWQGNDTTPFSQSLGKLPLSWIAAEGFDLTPYLTQDLPLPLLVFEPFCIMRTAATAALDRAGIPWRIAFTSRSLSGIWAAALAGLGVTLRTEMGMPSTLKVIRSPLLPRVGDIGVTLHRAENRLPEAAHSLYETISDYFPQQIQVLAKA